MKPYWLHFTPLGPLALNDETDESNFQRSRDAVPGGTLRGAVARLALERCTQPEFLRRHEACPDKDACPFWQLFGEQPARFGYAYPAYTTPADAFPLPLTAQACKTAPGLPPEGRTPAAGRTDPPHGVWDVLAWRFVETLAADPAFPLRERLLGSVAPPDLAVTTPACPICGAELKPFSGWAYLGERAPRAEQAPVLHRWQAHVGVNRARFAAQPGLFFVQELTELLPGWAYYAPVWLSAAQAQTLRDLLAEHATGFIGGGRSRGYGRVVWALGAEPRPLPPLRQRLTAWRWKLMEVWEARFPDRPFPDGVILPLTLRSPALLEDWDRPYLVPTPEDLGLPEAALLMAWTAPETLTGWHEAAHLPRRTRQAATAGSVYVFFLPTAWHDAGMLAALEALEARGLGHERERGLGEVVVAHPWHERHAWVPGSAS